MGQPGERALIIDDDPSIARMFQRFFQSIGWTSEVAADGFAALRAFKPGAYRVVFCDVNLGSENGLEIAKTLRKLDPALRIIIVSGLATNIDEAKAAGFAFFPKPCDLEELKTAVGAA